MWQYFILEDQWLGKFYSEWIDPRESQRKKLYAEASLFARYAKEMMIVARLLGKAPHRTRVLDYGMGWGYWCLMARAFGYDAYGTDLSEERMTFARGNGVNVLRPGELPEAFFDFINAEQCFEHLYEPLAVLKSLVRALVPGGIVRVSVPDAGRAARGLRRRRWRPSKDPFLPLEHISSFTHRSLVRLGREAGLVPVHRPLFPLVSWSVLSLARAVVAPYYYRFCGTCMYFRQPAR